MAEKLPRVVIVGGGFGGLAAAKALRNTQVQVVLIDRNNHHLFQPLLYQVATAVLGPAQIAFPIRSVVRDHSNLTVILGEVTGVDKDQRRVFVDNSDRQGVPLDYDYLILATGAQHNYFGHDEFAKYAPGLKGLADAVAIRNKILQAFEQAEAEEDPSRHQDLLTFVLVGAGPTGVEMASAIATLVHTTMRADFRRINPESARVLLVDHSKRVLGSFSEKLSAAAQKRLESLGVELRLNQSVESIDEDGVIVSGERIFSRTVIWTAGVSASPAAKWLKVESDHAGRVMVQSDLSLSGHPEIFVIGDTASINKYPLPGVAQVAIQEGAYVGKLIHRRMVGDPAPKPFRYFDKGNMAVVGKGFAILETGKLALSGLLAWLAWAAIHIQFLGQGNLRVSVLVQWTWAYLTGQIGSRLIVNHHPSAPRKSAAELPLTADATK
jgi:NADH:ubiquinone reductase (H+-translocating)